MEQDNMDYNSDEDVNFKEHSRLVDAISKLDKTQHIKKPTRNEPTLQSSEFHLVKSGNNKDNAVLVTDLVKALGKTAKHTEIGKKLRSTQKKTKTLQKPLEKPQAERIQRSVGFDKVKKLLGRWDAVVSRNRVAPHQSFPLYQPNISMKPSSVFLSQFRVKSDLEKELEAAKPPKEIENEDKEEFPLTMEEIMEQRKEAAKLRAQQSYREAKARRQSKIKSKKFHRVQRREKIKQKLKEFEILQKNDPEAALQKLEELEKTRAGERASLRHRSTGKWAQNLLIRAKHDKESRAELAQQLAVSRDLTQKIRRDSSESEEEDENSKPNQDQGNPWTQQKTNDEIADFVSGYRKYWEDQNATSTKETTTIIANHCTELVSRAEDLEEQNTSATNCAEDTYPDESGITIDGVETFFIDTTNVKNNKTSSKRNTKQLKNNVTPSKSMHDISEVDLNETILDLHGEHETSQSTSSWIVTELQLYENVWVNKKSKKHNRPIEEIFDEVEDLAQEKFSKKYKKIMENVHSNGDDDMLVQEDDLEETEYVADLSFKSSKKRPEIDAQMDETIMKQNHHLENDITRLKELSTTNNVRNYEADLTESIDPNKFINMKPKHLLTALPDMVTAAEAVDDNDEKENKEMIIAEAFEDDDIVTDFQKEKEDIINKDKPQDIDLSLPGWGSWGGANIKNTHKRKRFTIKFPKKIPRKDANKGELIMNENPNTKLKSHMVSELPFPFTSVHDFEASVRAPIGTTFIPVNASKKLTKPAISTKLGAIIEPMDEDMLVNKKVSKLKMK